MKHHPIANATKRNVGASQGYVGVDVRHIRVDCPVNGPNTPAMEMALIPEPAELASLMAGKPLIVQQLGMLVTPFSVYVEDTPAEKASGRWTQQEDLFLHAYFDAVGDRIGSHDLGRPEGAATKRVAHLKRTGAWAALTRSAQAIQDYRVLVGRPALDEAEEG